MDIKITPPATRELKELEVPGGHGLRIDAEITGGCGCNVQIQLALDEPRSNDTTISSEHLNFFIDRFTKRYMDEPLTLDFNPRQGFKLYSPSEVLCYGATIN